MNIAIKKWGNSQGIVIPLAILKQLGIEVGQQLDLVVENGTLVLSPKKKKVLFSEAYLLKNLDEHNSHSDELAHVQGMETGE
ncbi:AbrB/MazE/SpoVT family DNA-binding domain-containing protein [Providencia sp. wls1943]|uniref:AbrB/MazE/SpoVT family DNA-binding domain-containing protein n=1 Tax=Providencia sp. wls1943 TaxID=2675150 RepID=UPI0012B5064B|nr:AbrB/MazE/SpoVT family DNA-binding domain-containing protein [Providencia sp. wls1943]MTB67195.1 AbrB/MazE/SpoVT family DNA-binding domain-containing protein [Providencia sp. wls1943]